MPLPKNVLFTKRIKNLPPHLPPKRNFCEKNQENSKPLPATNVVYGGGKEGVGNLRGAYRIGIQAKEKFWFIRDAPLGF